MACWKYRMQKWPRKSPSGHHPTTLSGYMLATKACIDNGKKLVKQQYLLHISPQYGELRPTSGWDRFGSLGHPSYFQRLPRLGSITARHVVVGVSQTLQRWTEGATYVWQGEDHVGHWPTFLVYVCNVGLVSCKFSVFHYKEDFSVLVEFLLLFSASFPGFYISFSIWWPKEGCRDGANGTETVQVTPLRRTIASSP